MNPSIQHNLRILAYESFAHRRFVVITFFVVVACALGVGWYWPQTYLSSATIIINDKNIIRPLMRGAAETTDARDRTQLAREIMQSRKITSELIDGTGMADKNTTPLDRQRLMDQLKGQINVVNVGQNLIRVEFKDRDPDRAFRLNSKLVELFINDNQGTRAKESEAAYNFIDEQVRMYQGKLSQADATLKQFRAGANFPRVGPGQPSLAERSEQTRLEIREAEIRRDSLRAQLGGEEKSAITDSRERELRTRLQTLQGQLNTLRLTYQDTYPDIARLKSDIEGVKRDIAAEQKRHGGNGAAALDEAGANALRQRLAQDLSTTETQIATLRARLTETERMLDAQNQQVNRTTANGATLGDLMRDRDVNQSILDDLLKRREAARVSMNLDRDRQGLSFQVQDEASLPLQPTGPRFFQFALGGLVLGFALPFGLLYVRAQTDTRIRAAAVIQENLRLPVVTVVPHLAPPTEKARASRALQWLAILAFSIVFVVVSVIITGSRI